MNKLIKTQQEKEEISEIKEYTYAKVEEVHKQLKEYYDNVKTNFLELGLALDVMAKIYRYRQEYYLNHKSFAEYVQSEIGMSHTQAYKLIKVAKMFKVDFKHLGIEKCQTLLPLKENPSVTEKEFEGIATEASNLPVKEVRKKVATLLKEKEIEGKKQELSDKGITDQADAYIRIMERFQNINSELNKFYKATNIFLEQKDAIIKLKIIGLEQELGSITDKLGHIKDNFEALIYNLVREKIDTPVAGKLESKAEVTDEPKV